MILKEATLYALKSIGKPADYKEVYDYIIKHKLYDFKDAKTPLNTVNSNLSAFITKGDERVKRQKNAKGGYVYFLSENQDTFSAETERKVYQQKNSYVERDLHKLFTTYLHHQKIYAKTIYHEQSKKSKDDNQKWVHPDIVGVKFSELNTKEAKHLLETTDKMNLYKLTSYELKQHINSDYELKEYFFQAVSNSSWANYGYLVTFEYNDSLREETERLSNSFGIGIILLKANPFESKVLFPATFHQLDFKTIDKLCNISPDFSEFIEKIENYISAEEKYSAGQMIALKGICDEYFENDSDIVRYCKEKGIEIEEEESL